MNGVPGNTFTGPDDAGGVTGPEDGAVQWEKSTFWQLQRQLAAVSRELTGPHSYARAAARSSKMMQPGLRSSPLTVVELAVEMVKESKVQANAQNGSTTPGRTQVRAANPQEKKDQVEEERQRHINEDINKQFWTAVDLSGQRLITVAPRLFDYLFLQKLYLNDNQLTSVPLAVTCLPQLRVLDLSHNAITELRREIGLMVSLKYLFLFDNHIKSLPFELGNLFQLELLGLEGNPLEDKIRSIFASGGTRGLVVDLRDHAPAGAPPESRKWLELDVGGTNAETQHGFSLLSYNTLCDRYATPQLYGYTPSWALSWEYRSKLLVEEVLAHETDIVCLQEVNLVSCDDVWIPSLIARGYKSLFYPKTRARTMASQQEAKVVDGCVIFYKADKMRLIDKYCVEYNSKALLKDDLKKSVDIFNRVMTKDNVALIAGFEHIETGQPFLIANTHLHWDPAFKDVKLVQSAILLEEVETIAKRYASNTTPEGKQYPGLTELKQLPVMVCGDFNSTQDSGVYQLFSQSTVEPDHADFGEYSYGDFTDSGMSHGLSFKSAYADGMELPFTNHTPNFVEAIDYIWYTTQNLNVTTLLGPVDEEYAKRYVGFPNAHHPSDHIPIATSVSFNKVIGKG